MILLGAYEACRGIVEVKEMKTMGCQFKASHFIF
ncbi:hypothetical protein ST398NM01_2961 [Staphylococcus aureus subsp. aureus 71193]|nr:hypothetical protein ST398NM01_2961 [Staphylococcus aureus subsp. aureus 71193]